MSKISFYGKEYDTQSQLYEIVENELLKYLGLCSSKVKDPQKKLSNLLSKFKMCLTMFPDRSTVIFRTLGIWGLPPDEPFLEYIKNFINETKIDTIIDYGAGIGLWSKILSDYLSNVKIIAYDIKQPLENNDVSKQRGFYNIETTINLSLYTNSLLILIWPPYNTRMAAIAIKNFVGNYVIHYGDKSCTGNGSFYNILELEWTL